MLENVPVLKLNSDQTLAATGFFEFLLGPEKELNISGPGGVGKTFLMGHLIDEIMPMYLETCQLMGIPAIYTSVDMMATTNKAAEVLGQQTGRPTSTVHAYFGLKVQDNYSTGESTVTKSNSWTVHQNKIIFIDEASMIDRDLYEFIQEGTCKCKIVYCGDKHQMAPVKEVLSPVYLRKIPTFELLEPMRTTVPELQALNAQCRAAVQSGTDTGEYVFEPIQIIPGIIDWLDGPDFEAEIATQFAEQTNEAMIMAYTNKRVVEYNNHIRELRGLPTWFTQGEQLINNSALRIGKYAISVEDEIFIAELDEQIEMIDIDSEVQLAVRYGLCETAYGDQIRMPIPVDMEHYGDLLKWFKKVKNWNRFYHLKNSYPDLRQRDARTVYKAQGSSTGVAYIDVGNLSTCTNPAQAARQLYVGVSRARFRVVFFGVLASKYGGLIE